MPVQLAGEQFFLYEEKTMKTTKTDFFICSFTGSIGLDLLLANPVTTGTALFDPGNAADPAVIRGLLQRVGQSLWGKIGVRLFCESAQTITSLFTGFDSFSPDILVLAAPGQDPAQLMKAAKPFCKSVFLEVYSAEDAQNAEKAGYAGILIRGNENGGLCSVESNYSLQRKIRSTCSLPRWVIGGMGTESAAAAILAGAEKVLLSDSLLTICNSSSLLPGEQTLLSTAPRSKAYGLPDSVQYRTHERTGADLSQQCNEIMLRETEQEKQEKEWHTILYSLHCRHYAGLPPLGEEALWASRYEKQNLPLGTLLENFNETVATSISSLREAYPLRPGNPLAEATGIKLPIFQGPMAHVSDKPEFLLAVAENGALPFAALAVLKGKRIETLLHDTTKLLAGKPWGAGIIGFAPTEILNEQLALLDKYPPSAVIIAGGRPGQYAHFAERNIPAYLHVPSPGLIKDYFQAGVRHFIFEGRGSGGHIGPIHSLSLWQAAVHELTAIARENETGLDGVHIILAGGISDSLSAQMAASFAPPLEKLGARFGIIMGTAYLSCDEAVATGAIVPEFKEMTIACSKTVVLESGDGHAIRCASTEYADQFFQTKSRLTTEGMEAALVRQQLDSDNIGRLRIASRGITRSEDQFISLKSREQQNQGCYMMGETAGLINSAGSIKDLHRTVSAAPVEEACKNEASKTANSISPDRYPQTDIAVIGMSCLLPGAQDLDTLWHNILAEMNLISTVPAERWNSDVNFDPDPATPDKIYSQKGGFLDDVYIDSGQYGIPPTTVPSIEPAQLLALEAVNRAIEDAGFKGDDFDREHTSVFFGTSGGGGDLALGYSVRSGLSEYLSRSPQIPDDTREKITEALAEVLPEWTENSFPGILSNVVAGRISNRFDLKGLNFTVDAACASSLAAIRVACQELVYGDTNIAVVGGVDTTQHPFGYTCFSKTHALSPQGESRPFHEHSDGIVLGEGVGVVILKRLNEAIEDNDRVYAVIKGVGGASDGKGRSMTAPAPEGQILAVERAYKIAGYSPSTISLIEAHGTGTALGDRTELSSMRDVLSKHNAPAGQCAVGSIKSAIGHTKAAAGVSGLIKACLALHHKILPATLNVEEVSSEIRGDESPLYVNSVNRPWIRNNTPRRAGVNSFGFGGTNFHVALEESPLTASAEQLVPSSFWQGELFCLQGEDETQLTRVIDSLAALVAADTHSLTRLSLHSYEMGQKLQHSTEGLRLSIVAKDPRELHSLLQLVKIQLQGDTDTLLPPTVHLHRCTGAADSSSLAFLFSGQGSQKRNMGSELAMFFPTYRETLDSAAEILTDVSNTDIFAELFPRPGSEQEALVDTTVVQPSLAVTEMAMFRLLTDFGIQPGSCAGHSFGELTSLWAGGAMDDKTFLELSVIRGKLMGEEGNSGSGMTAVRLAADDLAPLMEGIDELYLANSNSPQQTVLAGSTSALSTFEERCSKENIRSTRLTVSHGFHSPFMAEAADKWKAVLVDQHFTSPRLPVFSNLSAAPYPLEPDEIADLLGRHLQSPVRFTDQIRHMQKSGTDTFVEIGPGRVLCGLSKAITGKSSAKSIALAGSGSGTVDDFISAMGRLWALGFPVDISPLFRVRHIALPPVIPQNSATLFRVNGGRSLSTTAPAKELSSKPSLHFANQTTGNNSLPQNTPAATPPVMESSRLQMISSFQDTMSSFLDQQESAQQERKQMMQQMWGMQESLFSMLTGGQIQQPAIQQAAPPAPSVTLPVQEQSVVKAVPAVPMEQQKNDTPIQSITAITQPDEDVSSMLLKVISDRTGYPEDMLSSDQHLESDLGIDSIKRVEILTALKDCHPALADIANERYFEEAAQLRTIGEIQNWIGETFSVETAAVVPDQNKGTETAEETDISSMLLTVISERTGYPADMLSSDQHLESDLGIDSIKRVEILTALKDCHPALADIANEQYFEEAAQLRTIGEIQDWIGETFSVQSTSAGSATPTQDKTAEAAGEADISAMLLTVISERTGYPADMLSHDQHLESDLGIDSIKRVEILTALKDCHPALADIANERYFEEAAQLRSIGEIQNWIETTFAAGVPAEEVSVKHQPLPVQPEPAEPVAGPAIEQKQPQTPISRYLLELVEAPFITGSQLKSSSGVVIILAGSNPLGAMLHQQLTQNNRTPLLITRGSNVQVSLKNHLFGEFRDQQEIDACVKHFVKNHERIAGVINLLALEASPNGGGQDAVKNSFRFAKSLAGELKKAGEAFWFSVSTMGGDFGLKNTIDYNPFQNGCHGIAKTIGHEWSNIHTKCIDLHPGKSLDQQVRAICLEMNSGDDLQEVCWDGNERSCIKLRPAPSTIQRTSMATSNHSVFLLTGGGRGITAAAAIELAKRHAPTLILTGRSPLPQRTDVECTDLERLAAMAEGSPKELQSLLIQKSKEAGETPTPARINSKIKSLVNESQLRKNILEMESYGATVHYYSVDCSDKKSFTTFIRTLYQEHSRIDGVVHGAGVIRDSLIINKDEESFDQVMNTKVTGAAVLAKELRQSQLSFLIFFSSISGRFGNSGQVDYAAANEILNKLAVKLNTAWPARVTAVNWGPWESVGMVNEAVRRQFDDLGISLIPLKTGVDMLMAEMLPSKARAGEVVIFGNRELSTNIAMQMDESLPLDSMTSRQPEDLKQKAFQFTLGPDTHPYLLDHRIDGNPVLPAAMALEFMAEAAVLTGENLNFSGMRNFRLFKGIIFPGNKNRTVHMTVSLVSDIANVFRREYEVKLQSANMPPGQANYSCTVILDNRSSLQPVELDQLHTLAEFPLEMKEIYDTRLFHEGMFQRITTVQGVETDLHEHAGIKGVITPSDPQSVLLASGKWLIDPLLFDCAYQLSLLWSQEFNGMMPLPGNIGEYKRFQPYDGNDVFCEVAVRKCDTPLLHLDFLFKDKRDRLYARARDVQVIMSRELNLRVMESLQNRTGRIQPHKLVA